MKNFFLSTLFLLLFAAVGVTSCKADDPIDETVTEVKINKPTLTLAVGKEETLTAEVLPESATNNTVVWSSSNTAFATVDPVTGKVVAIAVGKATIKATADGKFGSCEVTVVAAAVPVEKVELDKKTHTMVEGDEVTLVATISPGTATNQDVVWSSNAEAFATVDQDGKVTAIAAGEATITVTTDDGEKTDTCVITVEAAAVPVTGVSIQEGGTLTLGKGATKQLTAVIAPAGADNKNVSWESDNDGVATVSATGLVEAVGTGTAKITVTTEEGEFTADCVITVPSPVSEINLKWQSATVEVGGGTYTMIAEVLPADASVKGLTWTSDNTGVATVNASTGAVEGLAAGKATITATAADGSGITASWKVTVMTAPLMEKCAEGTPRFGESLGTVSFLSDRTWTIEGSELVWSDAVQASVATGRTVFQGSDQSATTHYCDCRDGNTGYGDFFTWCTAIRFRNELCPDGWRIPSTADFVELDIALGGTGVNRTAYDNTYAASFITPNYVERWGGGYGGNCAAVKPMYGSQVQAAGYVAYWIGRDVEGTDIGKAKHLGYVKGSGYVYVDQSVSKGAGEMLRCVR